MKFITSLEKREVPSPKSFPIDPTLGPFPPKGFDRQVCYALEVWADANLVAAEKHRCDKNLRTWKSVRRVLACREGEDFMQLEQIPFRLKMDTLILLPEEPVDPGKEAPQFTFRSSYLVRGGIEKSLRFELMMNTGID